MQSIGVHRWHRITPDADDDPTDQKDREPGHRKRGAAKEPITQDL
jgi:hypothetical protein